jgi:hypothetical protein
MPSRRDPINELRREIDRLPVATRSAMLAGIRSSTIVVGAYTDSNGGVCPMLAAHRQGERTDALAFAKAWDVYGRARKVRRASRRELRVLERLLLESLEQQEAPVTNLGLAVAEHQAMRRATAERDARETPQELSSGSVLDRPRKSDVERALANFEQHVAAAERWQEPSVS